MSSMLLWIVFCFDKMRFYIWNWYIGFFMNQSACYWYHPIQVYTKLWGINQLLDRFEFIHKLD